MNTRSSPRAGRAGRVARRVLGALCALGAAAGDAAAQPGGRPVVAVLDLQYDPGMPAEVNGPFVEALGVGLARDGRMTVVEPARRAEALDRAGGCRTGLDAVCRTQAGRALGADAVVVGSVGRDGPAQRVTLRLFAVEGGALLGAVDARCDCYPTELPWHAAGYAQSLSESAPFLPPHREAPLATPAPRADAPPPRATPAVEPGPPPAWTRPTESPPLPEPDRERSAADLQDEEEDDFDLFTIWLAGKAGALGGTGDVFARLDRRFGYGAEAGIGLLFLDLEAQALAMGAGQYVLSAALGFDKTFGSRGRFDVGLFTGPMFFVFPPSESAGGLDLMQLTPAEQSQLDAAARAAGIGGLSALDAKVSEAADAERKLGRTAIGWNAVRLRLGFDYALLPVLYLGAGGHVAYHFLISGEDIAAGAKNKAVDKLAKQEMLPDEARELLRKAVGAKAVDRDTLDGLNWDAGIYLRFEL